MSHKHHHHNRGEAPHEAFVGTLIALTVVSIVMKGLFLPYWIELIPQLVLFIHLIKSFVIFIQDSEARKNYVYHTELNDVFGIWIALIVVSIIMNALFGHIWFAQIAPAVLRIKAVEITILYFVSLSQENRRKRAEEQPQTVYIAARPVMAAQPEVSIRVKTPGAIHQSVDPSVEQPVETVAARYCHICGEQVDNGTNFCAYCGADLRR